MKEGTRVTGTVRRVIVNRRCAFVDGEDGTRYFMSFRDCPAGAMIKRDQRVSFLVDSNVQRGQNERAWAVVFVKDAVTA